MMVAAITIDITMIIITSTLTVTVTMATITTMNYYGDDDAALRGGQYSLI